MFENAKWITRNYSTRPWSYPPLDNQPPSPYLVRDFEISEKPISALLSICGMGQSAYYINGERVPDSILPTEPSDHSKTVIYKTHEIADMLHIGTNRLGVVLGNNAYADPASTGRRRPRPEMIAQLDITYKNGKTETIVSDTSFKTADSPTLFSLRRCGEKYDARLETEGWNTDCDISSWDSATVSPGAGGAFRTTLCPPHRITALHTGKEIAKGVFDFGIITSGWIRMKIRGKRGSEVTVIYAERLSEDRQHITHDDIKDQRGPFPEMHHRDKYILKGEGEETFEPLFSYHGFQYVEILGEYDSVEVTALTIHTDLKAVASFSCDNGIINKIHNACVNSMLTCAHGAPVDCPQREQNEWTGDGMVSAEIYNISFDAYGMYYEWLLKFKDAQLPSGFIPGVIPVKEDWPYNFACGIDWSSAIIHIPYYVWKYSGNIEIVELMWENMERAMAYFAKQSDTNLINNGVSDWSCMGSICEIEITDTIYYRLDALLMAKMAEGLGKNPTKYSELAENIKIDFRAKYVTDGRVNYDHITAVTGSIYSGMLNEDEIPAEIERVAEMLKSDGYAFTGGIHCLSWIFDLLSEAGYTDLLFKTVTNEKVDGYAKNVKDGLTALPERFDAGRAGCYQSLNHQFTCMVDAWFYRWLAGIRFEGIGTEELVIAPNFVEGINTFTAEVRGVKVQKTETELEIVSPYPFTLKLGEKTKHLDGGRYTYSLKG